MTLKFVHVLVLTNKWSYYVHGTHTITSNCVLRERSYKLVQMVCAAVQSGIIRYLPSQECRWIVGFRTAIICRSDQPYLLIALAHCGKFPAALRLSCCVFVAALYLSVGQNLFRCLYTLVSHHCTLSYTALSKSSLKNRQFFSPKHCIVKLESVYVLFIKLYFLSVFI